MATTGVQPTYKATARYPMIKSAVSATIDPASVATGAGLTGTVVATNAVLGDFILVSAEESLGGLDISAYVSAADTVTWLLQNVTGGAVDLASNTFHFLVLDKFSGIGVGI